MRLDFNRKRDRKTLLAIMREVNLGKWNLQEYATGTNHRGFMVYSAEEGEFDPFNGKPYLVNQIEIPHTQYKELLEGVNYNSAVPKSLEWMRH